MVQKKVDNTGGGGGGSIVPNIIKENKGSSLVVGFSLIAAILFFGGVFGS